MYILRNIKYFFNLEFFEKYRKIVFNYFLFCIKILDNCLVNFWFLIFCFSIFYMK